MHAGDSWYERGGPGGGGRHRDPETDQTAEHNDDGPGVPAPFPADLFQPGRRADPADGHGRAGLGLPLARRLAWSAGGEVGDL